MSLKNMHRDIVYISDFFIDHLSGGAELNDNELIRLLQEKNYKVEKNQSHLVGLEFLVDNKDCFFIISNFCNLSSENKIWISENCNYIIYEHDHKYLKTGNPADYKNYKVPQSAIRNFFFYKEAEAVVVQSTFHKSIVENNLTLKNIFNISGNLWSSASLEKLRENCKKEKKDRCSILNSDIPHKNTAGAVTYCERNNLEYNLVNSSNYLEFLDKLGANQTFVFFPKTPETLSRVVVEARMMNMSVKTNALVGACEESWFKMKGEPLIDYMTQKKQEICDFVEKTVKSGAKIRSKGKKVSIISTFHDGSEHLEGFLEDTVKQTIFDECELIFVDAASTGPEESIISRYMEKYDNISYMRIEEKLKPTPCLNMAIKNASGKYITFGLIDDRKKDDCLEILLKGIENSSVELVYGDVLQTDKINETFADNSSKGKLFEHSRNQFSKENMIKCLPGPMPLWKSSVHDKVGFFDQDNCNFADDWDMWLRMVAHGYKFKKIDDTVGLYYSGGRSFKNDNIEQKKEEAKIFFKYSYLFGENFNKFLPYFQQFAGEQNG